LRKKYLKIRAKWGSVPLEQNMLKAVTFDFWGTLMMEASQSTRRTRAERIRRIDEVLREERIIVGAEAIDRAYDAVGERLVELWTTLRDIGVRAQVDLLLDSLQVSVQFRSDLLMDRLVDGYTLPILSDLPIPFKGAPDVLSALDARGFRMAVICNTGRTPGKILRIILECLGMGKYLSVQTFSDEIGLRKPHPEIFERTLAELGVEPSEALHVGDTLASDVAGAHGIGMRAVHLCHPRGADPNPGEGETIFSIPELLKLMGSDNTGEEK
jgi:putative hydrolase of the HAD superfamily